MFFFRPSIPIPVIPVIYLRVSHLSILYITIYISISYVVFRRGFDPSLFNWNYWNWNSSAFLLLLFSLPGPSALCESRCTQRGHSSPIIKIPLRDVVMTKKGSFQVCTCTVFNIKKCGAHTTLKSC